MTTARQSALRLAPFRRVWFGATVSSTGDAASWIALVALALTSAHANVAVLVALYTAPVAVGGLIAGWALDRFDRRRLLIADSLARAAVFASIPIAAAVGHVDAIQLYAVAAVYGALKMISLAGFPSIIPALVPDALLDQANALEGASFGLASLVGAALAGVVIATLGAGVVVAADAVSYVVFAACLATVTLRRDVDSGASEEDRAQPEQSTGLGPVVRAAIRNPWLRDTTLMFMLFNVGEGALLVFLPHRAVDLGLGAGGYGWLVAATTGGELIAAAILARSTWHAPLIASIIVAQVLGAALILGLIVALPVSTVITLVLLGLCTAPMTAWAQSVRMRAIPASQRGRLFALLRTLMQATPPIGAGLAAVTLPLGGTATVVVIAAVMGLPALLLSPDLLRRRTAAAGRPLPGP
jgi:MFS family permease